jgi:peptidoglycan/LPS O-acetylase OafA/YrhL
MAHWSYPAPSWKTVAYKSMTDAYRTFASIRHFSGLDALRAISVLGVIWSHVTAPHALRLLNQGHMGVDLFFAISGFLVTTLLLREYRHAGHISLRNFYIRRTLRIFPLYYVVLALYCMLVFATMRGTPKAAEFWQNLPAFATYTSNWFVDLAGGAEHGVTFYFAWSLATEEQFYLFWPPLLVLLLWKSPARWVPALAALALLSVQVAASTYGSGGLLSTILGSLAPAILFGVAFAVLLDSPRIYAAAYPVLGHRAAAPAALIALLACLQLGAPGLVTRFVMALLVATLCIREDTVLHPVLRWRPAVVVGTISYGIYLMHMLAANAVRKVVGHAMGLDVFVLTTLVVIAMAWISFRYFESPVMRLKNRFQAARPDSARAVAAPAGTAPITDIHLPGRHHA